jgi:hypothetical protein
MPEAGNEVEQENLVGVVFVGWISGYLAGVKSKLARGGRAGSPRAKRRTWGLAALGTKQ